MKRRFDIDRDNRLKVQIGYNDTLEPQVMFTLLMSDCDGNESTQCVVVRNNSTVYNKCNDVTMSVRPLKNNIMLATVLSATGELYVEVNLTGGAFDIQKVKAPKLSFFCTFLNFIFG